MSVPTIAKVEELVRVALASLCEAKEQLRAKLESVGIYHPALGTLETAIDRTEVTRAELVTLGKSLGIARVAVARRRRA